MNEALFQQAFAAHQAGDLQTAHRLYHQILQATPGHFDALFSLARMHFQCGQFEESERITSLAVKRNPHSADAWYLRGCALQRLNRHANALVSFARSLTERPRFAQALVNRGASLMALKRPEEALRSFDAALAAEPNLAEAWNNRGNALSALGRAEDAVESYSRVLKLMPGMAEALINRGTAYQSLKNYREALTNYDEALRLRPQSADALSGRANALFELNEYEPASDAYKAVLAVNPGYKYALGNFAFSRLHCCDWNGLNEIRHQTLDELRAGKAVISPFQAFAFSGYAPDHLQCADIWAADRYPAKPPLWTSQLYTHEKIRVAYVSGDLRNHAVAKLMAGVFESHDPSCVEIIGISFGPDDQSPLRARVMRAFDFIDASALSDAQIAALIKDRNIDIAVDLMGFTGDCRPGIFSYRAAPLQVNFLGYAGTMGAQYVDYILADRVVIPQEHHPYYREKVAYLPDTYMPWDSRQVIATPPSRSEAGLPEKGFVFSSFNNSYKFGPETFDVWMRVLSEIPESVLWLHEGNSWAMRNLKAEAERRGIAETRVIFAPYVAQAEDHLARLSLADLFLDTLPYNAHATAIDALTAGVPVLTLPGATFPARVAASVVQAAGIPEMIVVSYAEYETLALKLARDAAAHAAVKAKLARNKATAPLFDTARFTRGLENAYVAMRARQRRGEPPLAFAVDTPASLS